MWFIEDPNLNRLSVLLRHFDAGDRILKGCIELFSTEEKSTEDNDVSIEKLKNSSQCSCTKDESAAKSSVAALKQDLLSTLLSAMNQCYPDYDFSALSADKFSRPYDFAEVYNSINYHLAFLVERCLPGFLEELWAAIRGAVDLSNVEIYSCRDPFADESELLFCFDYFFYDKIARRILFLSCVTTSKNSSPHSGDSQQDSSDDDDDENEFSFSDFSEEDDKISQIDSSADSSPLAP